MEVRIDRFSGFCWGVVRTVEIAEKELAKGGKLYSLGDIIHNPKETERLRAKGLETITYDDLEHLRGATVLIRAHGEPSSTYKRAEELGITLIDATCPVVTKVQERIRKFYLEGYQILIFGKRDHAEVIGLVGQANGEAVVLESPDDLKNIRLDQKTVLFSQTTMDKPTFAAIREELMRRIKKLAVVSEEDETRNFYVKDTICGQVSGREKKIREFAAGNDVVLFVAGTKSSNGKVLFNIVESVNPRSYAVEDAGGIKEEWFAGAGTVGITGSTSTPQWLMEQMKKEIENRYAKSNKQSS
jgi:4-hydroxy-3-methylbut-2-enyl diphosphate reductase